MWFRRRRRRPQLDLAALDRLAVTISRAVALIEEKLAPAPSPPARESRRPIELVIRGGPEPHEPEREREPEPESQPAPEPEPEPEPHAEQNPEPEPARESNGFVLFVPTSAGYVLVGNDGLVPERGERLRVEEEWYRVLRLGPSPLPDDARRCVFLEHAATSTLG